MDIVLALVLTILIYESIRFVVVNIVNTIKEEIYEDALDWYDEDGK